MNEKPARFQASFRAETNGITVAKIDIKQADWRAPLTKLGINIKTYNQLVITGHPLQW
jgi:hypothetical protein